MDPWREEEERPTPRRPGWGCLMAVIVLAAGTAVIAVMAARLIGAALSGVHVR